MADGVAQQQGDAAAALLVEDGLEGFGDRVLPRVVQTGEEDHEALLLPWRIALSQSLYDGAERTGQEASAQRLVDGLTRS